jgi:hypothetical protein
MAFSISTLARIAFGPPPEITCPKPTWAAGVAELRRRAGGRLESGAFLLGRRDARREIEEFVFYDDIDPGALRNGIVQIDGSRLGALWQHCRETRREVVADVHVHPYGYGQSASDRANPIIAEIGHIAMILPNFALGDGLPGGIGIYQYEGSRRWRDRSRDRASPLHIGRWPSWR